jgi:hypothetical protein
MQSRHPTAAGSQQIGAVDGQPPNWGIRTARSSSLIGDDLSSGAICAAGTSRLNTNNPTITNTTTPIPSSWQDLLCDGGKTPAAF